MNIAIIGTRGIPNNYGGFEQFAEFLSVGLVNLGHTVVVYNSHNHSFQQNNFKGVNIIKCYDPEYRIGTVGQFIYDFNCILDSRKRNFDIVLQLGYTSSSIWSFLFPSKSIIVTNMDGLEWKRTKYTPKVREFLKLAERWAVKYSDFLVADSIGIKQYLYNKYKIDSFYIPYGAEVLTKVDNKYLSKFGLKEGSYDIIVARLEPENSIELILNGYVSSNSDKNFVVIGNTKTNYGKYLIGKYSKISRIKFLGSIYNKEELDSLRFYSDIYFHGHTVGGTNPSLLEAMGCSCFIAAQDNLFNSAILGRDAVYFMDEKDVENIIKTCIKNNHKDKIESNKAKITGTYSWEKIIHDYNNFFIECKGGGNLDL